MTHYDLGSAAATASNPGISTGHILHTNHHDTNRAAGSGGDFRFTGTTTLAKAGSWPNADGYFYDVDGKQFALIGLGDITKFGARTGTNSTSALAAAIASTCDELFIPSGTFEYDSLLTIARQLRMYGPGTLSETTLLTTGILVTADDVTIEGITFLGVETLAAWSAGGAGYRQVLKSFVEFDSCSRGIIRDIKSSKKRGVVRFNSCTGCLAENIQHTGFFPAISSSVSDGNYYSVVRISGGRENTAFNCRASGIGSIVLGDLDTEFLKVSKISGSDAHDNFVYCSSGFYGTFTDCNVEDTANSGMKIRGTGHTVTGNVVKGATSTGIMLTGNGETPDAYNANGYGTVCSNNTIINCSGHSIHTSAQDGYNPRDYIISNNIIENHLGTAGFAAINVTGERGMKCVGNIIRGSTADYAIQVSGAAGNRLFDANISENIIANSSGESIRVSNVDCSRICDNVMNGVVGSYAIEVHTSDNNFITGNLASGGKYIRLNTTGLGCSGNIVTNNQAGLSLDNTLNVGAPPLEYKYDNFTPTYATTGVGFTSVTYGSVQGRYTVVGNLVIFSGYIDTNGITVGGATGSVVIGGLPFTSSNDGTGIKSAVAISSVSQFAANTPISAYINRNSNVINLFYRAAIGGSESALAVADLNTAAGTNNVIVFGGSYWVN